MKYHLVLLFILSLAQSCWGQTAFISGKVVDDSKLPIGFATALLFGETDSGLIVIDTFRTDQAASYRFDLDTVFSGYRILGNAPNYFANEIAISAFKAGDTLFRDIEIELDMTIIPPPKITLRLLIELGFIRMRELPGFFLLKPLEHWLFSDGLIERF